MEEKVFFFDSNKNRIAGIISNPNNNKKSIVILCHGFGSSKNSSTNIELQRLLNKKNISTFRFDFYGHGESEGKFEDITILKSTDDTLNAIKLLKEKGYSKIFLVGSSFGGMTALITASKTKDLAALVLKSPLSDFIEKEKEQKSKEELEDWKNKGFIMYNLGIEKKRLNYSYYKEYEKIKGYDAARKIEIPTLIIHGDADTTVPPKQSIKLAKILKRGNLELIKGADHSYTKKEDFQKMLILIKDFIIKNIT